MQYDDLVASYSKNPRDVSTIPQNDTSVPLWFYVSTDSKFIYIEAAKFKTPSSGIKRHSLKPTEFDTMLDFYYRRKKREPISQEAKRGRWDCSYWYGIFSEMGM